MSFINWFRTNNTAEVPEVSPQLAAEELERRIEKRLRPGIIRDVREEILEEYEDKIAALETQVRALEKDKKKLTEEKKELELDKKIEQRDIESLMKAFEKKTELEKEEYKLKCNQEKDKAIQKIRDEYFSKKEGDFDKQLQAVQDVTKQVMALVPQYKGKVNLGNS